MWLLSTLPAEASLEERISALLLTWTWMLLGGAAINWYSRLLLWRAVKYMDNHCDPEPLLELCSTVCRQNPSNMIFHVYQAMLCLCWAGIRRRSRYWSMWQSTANW